MFVEVNGARLFFDVEGAVSVKGTWDRICAASTNLLRKVERQHTTVFARQFRNPLLSGPSAFSFDA
jgi:hypothetical protein